jgi:hypothetical protein
MKNDTRPIIGIHYDKEGLPFIETTEKELPIDAINDILRMTSIEYKKKLTASALRNLSETDREGFLSVLKQVQTYKRLSFFWYACFMISLLILILGGN